MEQRLDLALKVSRIIAGALAGGVLLFWIFTWVLTGGGQEGFEPGVLPPRLAFWLWAAVALGSFAAALVFRGRAVQAGGPSRAPGEDEGGPAPAARVQTNLVIAWALLEGPALMAGVFFLLIASLQILSTAILVYGIGMALTFPRAEWFQTRSRG
jgi:hypothetical protein